MSKTGSRTRNALFLVALIVPGMAITLATFPVTVARAQPQVAVSASGIKWLVAGNSGNVEANFSNLAAGDSFIGTLILANQNSFDVRYALVVEATNPDNKKLRDAIQVEYRTSGTTCQRFDGQVLYRGSLGKAHIGDAAFGEHPGDRRLSAGSSEALCVKISLPLSAGNSIQGATTSATMKVVAEQIF